MQKLLVRKTSHLLRSNALNSVLRDAHMAPISERSFLPKSLARIGGLTCIYFFHDKQADPDMRLPDRALPLPVTRALVQLPLSKWNLEERRIPQQPVGPAAV